MYTIFMIKDLNTSSKKNLYWQDNFCCPVCENTTLTEYTDATRRFFRCEKQNGIDVGIMSHDKSANYLFTGCGSVFRHPECFLSSQEQSARYLLHKNKLEPAKTQSGYRRFLAKFADAALAYVTTMNKGDNSFTLKSIFDYGSGPEPSLVHLLEEYKTTGHLAPNTEIRGWDPFFAPNTIFFKNGADLVLCLEVAEHFETPAKDIKKLASAVRIGGIVALQTILVPPTHAEFRKWWYKEDPTHVTFYSKQGLELCAKNAGLLLTAHIDSVFFFQKSL